MNTYVNILEGNEKYIFILNDQTKIVVHVVIEINVFVTCVIKCMKCSFGNKKNLIQLDNFSYSNSVSIVSPFTLWPWRHSSMEMQITWLSFCFPIGQILVT